MFVEAIETAAGFTRAIHSIGRNYRSSVIQRGAATLFFVNSDGWALTCGHVAKQLMAADQLFERREAFVSELNSLRSQVKEKALRRQLEAKYGYTRKAAFEVLNNFVNCVEGPLDVEIKLHSSLDVALIRFRNFTGLLCDLFPTFASNDTDLKPGKFLCRLGFPFAEFSNYDYDEAADSIHWTDAGRKDTPRFPIEGMVTRRVAGESGEVIGFEVSTAGLRGQSRGPAFDPKGVVWGMQCSTLHLDLDFDVDQEVIRSGQKKHVRASTFLHVGRCIHVSALKSFMSEQGVSFQEG